MVANTKPAPYSPELVPCVRCGHDRTWHMSGTSSEEKTSWTEKDWAIHKAGTWDKGLCQWDDTPGTSLVNDEDPNDENKCPCKAFKHPNAPRRRAAIEHTRRQHGG